MKYLKTFAALSALAYGCLCAGFYCLQDRYLFPAHKTQGMTSVNVPPSDEHELIHLKTPNGDSIAALFGTAQNSDGQPLADASSRPTLIFFYGNGVCLTDFANEFHSFRRLGLNVIIPEYPGYGLSTGHASERSFYACADATYDYLRHRPDLDPDQIVAAGWSLGAAVATDLAARRPVMALATFSAFTSWKVQLHHGFPFLPTSLLADASFDNESKFKTLHCPVFLAQGTHDANVPSYMCYRLAAARGSDTEILTLNSQHNLFENHTLELMARLNTFIDHCRTAQTSRRT